MRGLFTLPGYFPYLQEVYMLTDTGFFLFSCFFLVNLARLGWGPSWEHGRIQGKVFSFPVTVDLGIHDSPRQLPDEAISPFSVLRYTSPNPNYHEHQWIDWSTYITLADLALPMWSPCGTRWCWSPETKDRTYSTLPHALVGTRSLLTLRCYTLLWLSGPPTK